jgi:cell shape-determining protein MreD
VKHLAWLLLTVLLLAIEAPMLRSVERWWLAPDVLVLAAVYLGSRGGFVGGLVAASAAGLIKDGFCLAAPVGVFAEIGAIGFLATRLVGRRVDLGSVMPTMATCGVATFIAVGLFLLFELIFHRAFSAFDEVLRATPSMALGTMLLSPLVFALYDRVGGLFERRDRMRVMMERLR